MRNLRSRVLRSFVGVTCSFVVAGCSGGGEGEGGLDDDSGASETDGNAAVEGDSGNRNDGGSESRSDSSSATDSRVQDGASNDGSSSDGTGPDDGGTDANPSAPPDVRIVVDGAEVQPSEHPTLAFGSAAFGSRGPRYRIRVTNTGGGTLTLPAPTLGAAFELTTGPVALSSGQSADLVVTMKTTAAGAMTADLVVTTPVVGKTTFTFPLKGTVRAALPTNAIVNPYVQAGTWRLWAEDAAPVSFTGYDMNQQKTFTSDFAPPAAGTRVYPDEALVPAWPGVFLGVKTYPMPPSVAGFWDDAYATLDQAHTNLPTSWSGSNGNTITLANQYIRIPFGSASAQQRAALGVNFTSESYAYHGHQLITGIGFGTLRETESSFTFVNTVRGTPGYRSFEETDPEQAADNYDALYGHSFQSLGRSGSELGGLMKMLVAGGHLPRTTKDTLKKNGAYATAMLGLFRQALPYADADGNALPYESEMRHRPVYLSRGDGTTTEFAPNNIVFHQYDDTFHLSRMVALAKTLTSPPPVAVFGLESFRATKDGAVVVADTTVDRRLKSVDKTNIRIWADAGETVTVVVDLGFAYDLEGRAMTFVVAPVYPEQKNVTVKRFGDTGRFEISVKPDATLPLGRIPIVAYADNGVGKSNAAFVNVFYPQAGQVNLAYNRYSHPTKNTGEYSNAQLSAVFRNKRPLLTSTLTANAVTVTKGQSTTFDLACTDPEGKPTRIYRWLGERGTLAAATFTFVTTATEATATHKIHFVCSDGTGGFGSLEASIRVQ